MAEDVEQAKSDDRHDRCAEQRAIDQKPADVMQLFPGHHSAANSEELYSPAAGQPITRRRVRLTVLGVDRTAGFAVNQTRFTDSCLAHLVEPADVITSSTTSAVTGSLQPLWFAAKRSQVTMDADQFEIAPFRSSALTSTRGATVVALVCCEDLAANHRPTTDRSDSPTASLDNTSVSVITRAVAVMTIPRRSTTRSHEMAVA
jgi:hypothetical protein